MGFQFNHVGGGTKTRRPITLHMKYNASCIKPACFLLSDDTTEREMDLDSLRVRNHHPQHVTQSIGNLVLQWS